MGFEQYRGKSWIGPFLLGVGLTLPLSFFIALAVIKRQSPTLDQQGPQIVQMHPAAQVYNGRGGRIEALRIPLANHRGKLPDEAERLRPASWFFEGYSEDRVDAWFRTLHAPAPYLRALLDRQSWTVTSNGCTIEPSQALVWFLPGDVRRRLYTTLAQSPQNYPQRVPFRFPPGAFAQSVAASGLKAGRIRQLQELTYTNDDSVCFADLQAAKEVLTKSEFENLVEMLYQTPTYRLRLHVAPDSDVDALVAYWGKGNRSDLIYPLLNGLRKVPNGASISVPFLLPPYARLRLYTYPESWHDPTAGQQDCLYTALNFFNERPDTNLLNQARAEQILASEYAPVNGKPTFGDIVMLLDPAGKPLHVCVYIVADFVFTKNGVNDAQPWVFMNLPDVLLAYYGPHDPQRLVLLRHKEETARREGTASETFREEPLADEARATLASDGGGDSIGQNELTQCPQPHEGPQSPESKSSALGMRPSS
jgi:hypothetical protein